MIATDTDAPPPRKSSKAETVYQVLRRQIVRLEREPGSFIDKAEVCDALGVSRFPVAEALGRLAREGLVDVEPQRGSYVALFRLADVREAIMMRGALEIETARLVAPRRDVALVRETEAAQDLLRQARAAGDAALFNERDALFHGALSRATGFPRLVSTVVAVRAHLERVNTLLSPQDERMRRTLEEHDAIHAALKAGDGDACAGAMRAHLASLACDVDKLIVRHPDYFRA